MYKAISIAFVAVEASATLAERWGLTAEEIRALIGCELTPDGLTNDGLVRISHLMHIYKTLLVLLPPDAAGTWVKRSNSATLFDGQSALDYMLAYGADGIANVHEYLDAEATQ